jgi:hypothetical protein
MAVQAPPPGVKLVTVAAMGALAWGLIALAFASLAPPAMVPRVFHNYHVEHLIAFYVIALLGAVGLPTVRLIRIGLVLAVIAVGFALFRILALVNKVFYAEDLVCDLAGILAALVPIALGRVRQLTPP